MDLEYDMKFEEMKKYIPFLENMIKRLESTGSGANNPRQAQLDKIRSLRDLLMVKKKRMKMENLLKCEQVLVNLYTKVEQRDTLPGIQPASKIISPKEKSDLNLARSKLKTVSRTSHDPDTLPEIARASETEAVCVPGSKEPALFQRRPNRSSVSPTNRNQSKSPQKSSSKRNYTRVLVSPDRTARLWSPSDGGPNKQLFSRRSPPKPGRRYSPSSHKRDRKKSSKQESHSRNSKEKFNITLKVPEERLDSLNTKDILSRIINCSDGDVDIATLRELRTQILGELKQTGANEDISDLILKSYKNKKRRSKKDDVEEGELSDSESEAIESIYGNLVVLDKDKAKGTISHQNKSSDRDEAPRKIQICLVINSDKEQKSAETSNKDENSKCDASDFEMFDDNECTIVSQPPPLAIDKDTFDTEILSQSTNKPTSPLKVNLSKSQEVITIEDTDTCCLENKRKNRETGVIDMNSFDLQADSNNTIEDPLRSFDLQADSNNIIEDPLRKIDPVPYKANFYKPLFAKPTEGSTFDIPVGTSADRDESVETVTPIAKSANVSAQTSIDKFPDTPAVLDDKPSISEGNKKGTDQSKTDELISSKESKTDGENKDLGSVNNIDGSKNTRIIENNSTEYKETSSTPKVNEEVAEIPLLNEPTVQPAKKDVVSEIDILQALKNEILSETIALPCAEVATPALHQPKVTKVSNAQDLPKKRISIENYKQKVSKPNKQPSLFVTHPSVLLSKEESRKQSLKLTDKEVERFKLAGLVESSDEEDKDHGPKSPEEDLAPKSPDMDLLDDVSVSPPVIIPADPVKTPVVSSKTDVDMRKLPGMSPTVMANVTVNTINLIKTNNQPLQKPVNVEPKWPAPPADPRVRSEKEPLLPSPVQTFPNTAASRTSNIPPLMPNLAPNMTPNRTPSRTPNMTPNARSFDVTPNRPCEMDDTSRKHVYAPIFGTQNKPAPRLPVWEHERSPVNRETPNWEGPSSDRDQSSGRKWDSRDPRSNFAHRDDSPRSRFNEPNYDNNYNRSRNDRYGRDEYNRKDSPQTSSYYGRSECPATPSPSFGRGDAPVTPTHYFGRSECPTTPSHPFGRSEGPPLTPSHPFGRSDAPSTPSHPFGRSDAPSTPSHPFPRADASSTPSHSSGRSDLSYNNQPSKYGKPQDPRLHRNYDNDPNRRDQPCNDRYKYNRNDPRTANREKSMERTDKPYNSDYGSNRDSHRDYDKGYSKDRSGPERSYAEVGMRRPFQREPSVGRSLPDQRTRASSVGRGISCERDTSNKVSVGNKWNAGRAFTIDTSVNSTFQKFLDSHRTNDSNNFDARRQRASSVGRSLTRESSVGRNISFSSSQNIEKDNRNKFQRAQSVGRDFSRAQSVGRELKERTRNEKSFKDIKAEFESYRKNDEKLTQEKVFPSRTYGNFNSRDPRCRRDSYEEKQDRSRSSNKSHTKEPNVPIKKFNYRDPRQRKEQKLRESAARHQRNISQGNRFDSRERHSYGISSESVTKIPVINSVKNYKIPKIKRPVEEKPEPEIKPVKIEPKKSQSKPVEKEVAKQKSTSVDKKVEKKGKPGKKNTADKTVKKNVPDENSKSSVEPSGKRVTRQTGRKDEENKSDDDEIVSKPRKFKKVIYHSDSDEKASDNETKSQRKVSTPKDKDKPTVPNTTTDETFENSAIDNENVQENDQEPNKDKSDENHETFNNSFGLDDMDLFSDSIIADPVLDNINALIADLDSDIDVPKGNVACADLFSDMNIENMLAKITTSPVKPYNNSSNSIVSPKTGVENVKKDLFDSLKQSELTDTECNSSHAIAEDEITKSSKIVNDGLCSEVTNSDTMEKSSDVSIIPQTEVNRADDKNDPEAVVSTSVNEDDTSKEDHSADSEKVNDGRSTPDSTNDAEIMVKNPQEVERLPDTTGTIEKQCEMNSDISSTHDSGEKPSEVPAEVPKDTTTSMDPIGSILSILQDKSKIKELLSMLGGQSLENDKIKKKLEKLSAIVSDDEDSNDDKVDESEKPDNITDVKIQNEEDKLEIENQIDKQEIEKEKYKVEKNNSDPVEQNEIDKPENEDHKPIENEFNESIENESKNLFDDESDAKKTEITANEDENTTKSTEEVSESNDADKSIDTNEEPPEPQNKKEQETPKGKVIKKRVVKRFKAAKFKKGRRKRILVEEKRVTRSDAAVFPIKEKTTKKPSRELKQLQESIKEMFMSDDILNASGIRMCRLAKMVDDKSSQRKDTVVNESEPVVVLEKVKHGNENEASTHAVDSKNVSEKPPRKKPGPKPKLKMPISIEENKVDEDKKALTKYRPGPKSKTKNVEKENDTDPYDFDTDSINDSKNSEKALDNSSDSDNDSLASSKSFGSSELLVEMKKKPKRKRPGWKAGVIKPKHKKKKVETKRAETPPREPTPEPERQITIPDIHCFTDKKYCFSKNTVRYACRLCVSTHNSSEIVSHYKKQHPHSEIPLSRMSPDTAREAIEQCEEVNFQAISKIPTEKYTCRFCYKEFARKRASLEAFFWHVVSMHTGEYKQLCSECINVTRCPFNLDIPPPPKDVKGQLIGYICGKCNFTQISLENLKMHVIVRHDDVQTEVYTINFAVMTKKTISSLVKRCGIENKPRVTRSSRSNQSLTEPSDDRSDVTESEAEAAHAEKTSDSPAEKSQNVSFKSKITFENDDNVSEVSNTAYTETSLVKVEPDDDDNQQDAELDQPFDDTNEIEKESAQVRDKNKEQSASDDIMDYPHFKIRYTDTGNKEYVCCINGADNHYKTGLLISMKKHVQIKHSERWDGYCFVCKVIVTSQGQHKFTECLQHFLDKHIDDFPVLEKVPEPVSEPAETTAPEPPERTPTPKSYINVRPLAELLVNTCEAPVEAPVDLPVIDNVVSLLPQTAELPRPSPTYPITRKQIEPPKEYKYEEAQADIMLKKHRVVLDAMMAADKLVQVFKCAGRFCSFTSDSAEDALLHASTHQRVGGTNALMCTYCDFDSSGNSIDLVSHVFKSHGRCQYACGLCFYRAAASQLVGAHIARVHGTTPAPENVLKAHNVPSITNSTEGNMTREAAVPLYVCKQSDRDETCLFKTVMHSKFLEHFKQRHEGAESVICYVCNMSCPDATSLVVHMKTHGLKLYQCTLCVFGADSEVELLAHASMKHPAKPPQAFIRTILGSPSTGLKILPLVELKKTALSPREVAPKAKENPVREAERSIELEKLIGHISILDNPPAPTRVETPPTAPQETPQDISNQVEEAMTNILENPETIPPMATLIPVPPLIPIHTSRPTTPAPETHISDRLTPVLKEEPKDTPEKFPDVICLDSDDEDSKQGIISLSDDETPAASEESSVTPTKVPANNVYKCGKCTMVCTSSHGFKKHLNCCYTKAINRYKCGHCNYSTEDVEKHVAHYAKAHAAPAPYSCGLCDHREKVSSSMKQHLKKIHNITKLVVKSSYGEGGEIAYVVSPAPDQPAQPKPGRPVKRKSSGPTPVTPTKRRYGPSDIDKLPINPILDELVHCEMCEFNTKVRLNMVRHLQLHAEQQPAPQVAPVNPVPHLETNEKHFDKMVNLASSSAATRSQQEKPAKEPVPTVFVPPELATRYPKYVPERHRHTCGAKGCSYISVDEGMLRRHWETLHSGTTDYHCVHCPPYQHLDKSKPLTAARIIAHLKMHDIRLYACSVCPYYHYRRQVLEKHMSENHRTTQVLVVREEAVVAPPTPPSAAPTMDLKPWQCGLCKFKSMLRPEVAEHCNKTHHSKMQFKCAYCPFRTSASENVTKHQTSAHANREPEIFYFYYREGSIPDDADGTPLWQQQRQKTGVEDEPEVKAEISEPQTPSTGPILPQIQPRLIPEVNLNLVKQEVDWDPELDSVGSLCKKFGKFCEPNGLNYKCSLCKVTVEDNKEAMQSHLYEELKYRKWGCRLCSYKAFHRTGLKEHMWTEHRQNQEPIELPVDTNVEAWVSKLLDYQEDLIKKNREKLAQQKIQGERPQAPTTSKAAPTSSESAASKFTMQELEMYFGPLGTPCNMMFCCPKCSFMTMDEVTMHDHLEAELSKIRWCCSNCSSNFTTYHEAQFHCKSVHAGQAARPVEAARDPGARAAWVAAAVRGQRLARRCAPVAAPAPDPPAAETSSDPEENSLLVVRYEETVPTPEEETLRRKATTPVSVAPDSDDDTLTIDEQPHKKNTECPHCEFKTKYPKVIKVHILRHYNLKPYTCPYCDYNNYKPYVLQHVTADHPGLRAYANNTIKPAGPPTNLELSKQPKKPTAAQKSDEHCLVCLTCEQVFTEANSKTHVHDKIVPKFAKKGEVVVKCCDCLLLLPDVVVMQRHYTSFHPNSHINYAYYKLLHDTRDQLYCFHCNQRFPTLIDLKSHHKANHGLLKVKYSTISYVPGANELSPEPVESLKRKAEDTIMPPTKRCARKSTTKLPRNKTVAKKSTSKLPFFVYSDSESEDEYSYYGTAATSWDELSNVTTLMPFCNTMVPFTLQKLSEIIKLNPKVVVKDCKK